MKKEKKQKQLTLRLSEDLHRQLKLSVVKDGRTMGEVVTDLIKEYLKNRYY